MTCDLGVRLIGPHGQTTEMQGSLVLVETRSETGESSADRELAAMRIRSDLTEQVSGRNESGRRGTRVRRAARQRPIRASPPDAAERLAGHPMRPVASGHRQTWRAVAAVPIGEKFWARRESGEHFEFEAKLAHQRMRRGDLLQHLETGQVVPELGSGGMVLRVPYVVAAGGAAGPSLRPPRRL